jgi:PhnB protein
LTFVLGRTVVHHSRRPAGAAGRVADVKAQAASRLAPLLGDWLGRARRPDDDGGRRDAHPRRGNPIGRLTGCRRNPGRQRLMCGRGPSSRPKEYPVASRLNPYISFRDNARQAMEFYQTVFGGNLRLTTFGEFGNADPAVADKIMHGMLETDQGYTIMGSDVPPGMDVTFGNNITVSLSGDDGDVLRGYWEKLSAGGTVVMKLEKQMWGDEYGACTDQFGISWMVNIGQPQS